MSILINQLKSEHATLAGLLANVQKMGVSSNESKTLLMKAKNALLAHLSKEDKELYPVLKMKCQNDEDLNRKLNNFGKDMEEITKFVLLFFENVENDKYNAMEYAQNFGKFISILTSRISREENILYPMYEDNR